MHYWNAADGGFYECQYHGARIKQIIDPDFEWPLIRIPDPTWQGEPDKAPMIDVRDDTVAPPMIEVPNPETKIPADAVEITAEHYQQLLNGLSEGKRIQPDADGHPVLVDPPPESLEQLAARKRRELDAARDAAFAAGLEYDFNGETDVVQTRPQDQVNLLGLRAKAEEAIEQGITDPVMKFRGEKNVTRYLTPVEMYTLTNDALAHIEGIYDYSWKRKDAINAMLEAEDRKGVKAVRY